jgi:predicted nucleotidyltransferase
MTSPDIQPREQSALTESALHDLPATVREVLGEFVQALTEVIGPELECVLLFGSAAEGRLRPTSDVNVAVLAAKLNETQLNALRTALKAGRAAVGLTVMFLESAEFSDACESFGMKFADMKVRHRVLYGEDPFAGADIPRDAAIRRLRQVLLNLKLRLRERYAMDGDQDDRLALALADMTGPIRVSAATLLALRDGRDRPPKLALQEFCADPRWISCLDGLSAVHGGRVLSTERARRLVADVLDLLAALGAAAVALS